MKKLLVIAIVLASSAAFATRARLNALGNAPHIDDAASVYTNPADIFNIADSLTIESGDQNVVPGAGAAVDGAEALLIKSAGDAKWALSLGHDDARSFAQRSAAASGTFAVIAQQNPIELTYGMKTGDMAWAGTLVYSSFNNKTTEVKESTMGLKFGVNASAWDVAVDLGLTDKWETSAATNDEFKGKSNIVVRGGYWLSSDMYVHGLLGMTGYEATDGGAAAGEVKSTDIEIGAINTMKNDGNEFFWGASLASSTEKDDTADTKDSSLMVPFIIGVEANAASWLTVRGSIEQNVIIQDEKSETGSTTTTDLAPGANSTIFAAGAGLKLGKLSLDGSILTGASNQNIDSANLLGTVGMTYSF